MLERLLNMENETARLQRFARVDSAMQRHHNADPFGHLDVLHGTYEKIRGDFDLSHEELSDAISSRADDEKSVRAFEAWLQHMEGELTSRGYL